MIFKETTLLEFLGSTHLTSEALNTFVLDCLFKDVCGTDGQGGGRVLVSPVEQRASMLTVCL